LALDAKANQGKVNMPSVGSWLTKQQMGQGRKGGAFVSGSLPTPVIEFNFLE
jgi:hypothetical protein